MSQFNQLKQHPTQPNLEVSFTFKPQASPRKKEGSPLLPLEMSFVTTIATREEDELTLCPNSMRKEDVSSKSTRVEDDESMNPKSTQRFVFRAVGHCTEKESPFILKMSWDKDIINKPRGKGDATFDPTHNTNPNYLEGMERKRGKMSLDPTHDNFELDLLEYNNPILDEASPNNTTLDEASPNNSTLDEESTNPTLDEKSTNMSLDEELTNQSLDEESTLHLPTIRKYIGFCRMPICLIMYIGSPALIERGISIGIMRLIDTFALIATVYYLDLLIFDGRLFAHLVHRISDADIPNLLSCERCEVILIMGVLRLTEHESECILETLQVDDLQKQKLVKQCGDVVTFDNVSDSRVYNATFHRRSLGEEKPDQTNFVSSIPIQEMSNVSPLKLKSCSESNIPAMIGGFEVNESGDIDSEFWMKQGLVIRSLILASLLMGMKGRLTSIFIEHTHGDFIVSNFDDTMVDKCLPIGTSATKVFDLNGNAIILIENQQIDHTGQDNSVLAANQLRAYGVARIYSHNGVQGRQSMILNDIENPFEFDRNLILLKASAPTYDELKTLPFMVITCGTEWNPGFVGDHSCTDLEWELLPSNDLGITNLEAHEIVSNHHQNGHNVQRLRTNTSMDNLNKYVSDRLRNGHNVQRSRKNVNTENLNNMNTDNLDNEYSFGTIFDQDVDKERGVDDLSLSSDNDSNTAIPLFDNVQACRTRSEHNNNTLNWKRVSDIHDVAQFTKCVEIGVNNWKREYFLNSFERVFTTLSHSSEVPKELCNIWKDEKSLSKWTKSACTEVERFIWRQLRYGNKHKKSNIRLTIKWAFKVIHDIEGSPFLEGYNQFT